MKNVHHLEMLLWSIQSSPYMPHMYAPVNFTRGSSSGKALGCGLDGPGSIPGVGGVEILLHSFMSRLVLGSTQPPIK